MLAEWQSKLEAAVANEGPSCDGSHDIGHGRRVWRMAGRIAEGTGGQVDRLVLLAAAFLHDIVSLEKNDPRRAEASRMAAREAERILTGLGFPEDKLGNVLHTIEAHSYSAGIEPRTIEAKILQDADRMETLGAIGLARIFYVGGRIGSQLFHSDDPLAKKRPLDDLSYSLDHFQTKILRLPDMMLTSPGRTIACERMKIIEQFLTCFLDEIGADQTSL